jgi:hypothetical protein
LLRIRFFLPDPENRHAKRIECVCCGGRYDVKRRGMKLLDGDEVEGEICPECVLAGPAGAAAKVRGRLGAMGRNEGAPDEEKERTSWVRLLSRRARLLEETPSFSLAARQAAVRETRERR